MIFKVINFSWFKVRQVGFPGFGIAAALTAVLCFGVSSVAGGQVGDPLDLLDRLVFPFIEMLATIFAVIVVTHTIRGEIDSGRHRLWAIQGGPTAWWFGLGFGCWLAVGLWLLGALLAFTICRPFVPGTYDSKDMRTRELVTRVSDPGRVTNERPPAAAIGVAATGLARGKFTVHQQDYLGPGESFQVQFSTLNPDSQQFLRLEAQAVSTRDLRRDKSAAPEFPLLMRFSASGREISSVQQDFNNGGVNYIPLPAIPENAGHWSVTVTNPTVDSFLVFNNRDHALGLKPIRGLELVVVKGNVKALVWLAGVCIWLKLGLLMALGAVVVLFVQSETAAVIVLGLAVTCIAMPTLKQRISSASQNLAVQTVINQRVRTRVTLLNRLQQLNNGIPRPLTFTASKMIRNRIVPLRSYFTEFARQTLALQAMLFVLSLITLSRFEFD